MPQLTYAQAKALKSRIVERLTEIFETQIKERQKKYDSDPAHKEISELCKKIDSLLERRRKLVNVLKKRNDINSYISEGNTKQFKFKHDTLVSDGLKTKIMDDLTIYTIGSNNGTANPQEIINKFVTKYSKL